MDTFEAIQCRSFYGKRHDTLASAIDELEQNTYSSSGVDFVIIPPNVDEQTDDEDIDEEDLISPQLPSDVPGQVEIHYEIEDEEDDMPLSVLRDQELARKKVKIAFPVWTQDKIDIGMESTPGSSDRLKVMKDELEQLNMVQVFEKLLDDEVVDYILTQTNLYAFGTQNEHNFRVSTEEIKTFLGILIFSGYHPLPRERLYWSLDEDVGIPLVAKSMSRNRFSEIKKYLHLADNSRLQTTDKMAKIRPFMTLLNKKFQQWGVFHEHLSIDEAMVKYFGHHSAKQFIRGKPVRFGYKDWMICSASGYCYSFDTYCGAKVSADSQKKIPHSVLPLGSQVVLDLLKVVEKPSDHVVFFDNYFTSHELMRILREKGFRATGTVRDNRTKKCPLPVVNEMKKQERGYFEYQYDKSHSLLFVRWNDNSSVTVATNYDCIEPLSSVKRWSSKKKEKVAVPQPQLIKNYNTSMGGVDLLDQSVNNYRVAIHGKKWWWILFTHMLNITVVNAWRVYTESHRDEGVDLLGFQRNIARHYLRSYPKAIQRRPTSSRPSGSVPRSIIEDPYGHFPKKVEKQLRCR